MRSRYILIFLTLVLLLVPSISIVVSAGQNNIPPGTSKGDIVLIRYKNIPPLYTGLTYQHAMLYIGEFDGVPRVIDADGPGVLNETWDQAIDRVYQNHGGYTKMVVVRVTQYSQKVPHEDMVADAIDFANGKVNLSYDSASQFGYQKQVKSHPDLDGEDSWWYGALPPRGGSGSTQDWIDAFSTPVWKANRYYCTELVWAAYFQGSQGNRYLENTPDRRSISGWEIEHAEYGQVQLIFGTPSGSPLQHDND